nr:hypothetical protein [uncultured Flavobacterium sp.]
METISIFYIDNVFIKIKKNILHECIHAYLHIKGMYPNTGASIPGIEQMDLQKL